jgi:probable addiction module antidote protein
MDYEYEVRVYQTKSGKFPFVEWRKSLKDRRAAQIVRTRIDRISVGNFGDCKWIGDIGGEIMAPTVGYKELLLKELQDPDEAIGYLREALKDKDRRVFLIALRNVADAQGGVTRLARLAHVSREHLYDLLSNNGNPELLSLKAIVDALGFCLSLEKKTPARHKKAA